jgi:hypothetical protein
MADAATQLRGEELATKKRLLGALISKTEVDPDSSTVRVHLKQLAFDDDVRGLPLAEELFVKTAPTGVDGSRTHQGRFCSTPQRF